jgi:RNA polymerase sigma-70 factor (ECF subfamily)
MPSGNQQDDGQQVADEALLRLAAGGQLSAFDALVRRWQDRVLGYAWRMLGDRHAAEDVTQQAFTNILRRAGRFAGRASFATYLYRTAHNLCLNERRRRRRHPAASLEAGREGDPGRERLRAANLAAETPDPAACAADAEQHRRVRDLVAALPAMYRQVVILRAFERLPFARIAAIAGTNESTIKSRFRYALSALAEVLGGGDRA